MVQRAYRSAVFIGLLAALPSMGQSYQERFTELLRNEDAEGQAQLLREWQQADGNNAELYVAYYNHYVRKSMNSMIHLDREPSGEVVLELQDPDTAKKDPIAYMTEETIYDPAVLGTAFAYIDTGIARFPQRLDMRFGKVYMYGESKDYTRFTDEIIRTIDHGAATDYAWTWTNNEPVTEPKDYMYSNVQAYVGQLYQTGNDSLTKDMVRISWAVLKHVPDNVESISTIAAIHIMNGQYEPALTLLLQAEKLAPQDDIVTSNIAEAYKRKGDKPNAIAYYKRTMELGDEATKEFARSWIEELER